jgi:hypothetical protein
MNSDDAPHPMPFFRGSVQDASYREQPVERYQGNPLIEALPDILSAKNAAKLMASYPRVNPDSYNLPPEIRTHLLMDATHFFEPLPVHIDLEQRISRLIRDGYVGRDPMARDHWHDIDQRVEAILAAGGIPLRSSVVNGMCILGIPGVGKSSAIERVLSTYPQVICHHTYKGKPFNSIQVPWLKLTCPFDGSIKGLCLEFFCELDGLLQTNYDRDYAGRGRRTVDELIPAMARVVSIHCLGLLVIDEIQHLNQAKSGGAERMLSFFLQLMNTLGLPVILIGTYAAMHFLSRELRQIRRSCGQGDLVWDRMANDEFWRMFAESLLHYQYTQVQVPLDQELNDVLYYESAGIIDFAVKLFLLAQVRAIFTGIEKITPEIIRSVARDSLRLAQPALHAIRTGDMRAVATMTDLHPIDFQSAVQQIRKAALLQQLSPGSRVVSDINAAAAAPPATSSSAQPVATSEPVPAAPPPQARPIVKSRQSKGKGAASKCLLVRLVEAGLTDGKSAHDALAEAGLIKPLFAFQSSPGPSR